jgi:hypothetical protein
MNVPHPNDIFPNALNRNFKSSACTKNQIFYTFRCNRQRFRRPEKSCHWRWRKTIKIKQRTKKIHQISEKKFHTPEQPPGQSANRQHDVREMSEIFPKSISPNIPCIFYAITTAQQAHASLEILHTESSKKSKIKITSK